MLRAKSKSPIFFSFMVSLVWLLDWASPAPGRGRRMPRL